jgi:translation initiation factor 1
MMNRDEKDSRIVYSTEHGRMCPNCRSPISECTCQKKKEIPRGDGIVRVGMERKGRRGKSVTVISGVSLDHDELRNLGNSLKKKCGAGGTVKGGVIEIQGDHRGTVMAELKEMGYVVKRSGG